MISALDLNELDDALSPTFHVAHIEGGSRSSDVKGGGDEHVRIRAGGSGAAAGGRGRVKDCEGKELRSLPPARKGISHDLVWLEAKTVADVRGPMLLLPYLKSCLDALLGRFMTSSSISASKKFGT